MNRAQGKDSQPTQVAASDFHQIKDCQGRDVILGHTPGLAVLVAEQLLLHRGIFPCSASQHHPVMRVPRGCSAWRQDPVFPQYHWGCGGLPGGQREGREVVPSTMWSDSKQLKGKRKKYLAECQSEPFPFFFSFSFFLLRFQQSMKMGRYVRNSPTL